MHKLLYISFIILFNYSFSSPLTLDEVDNIIKKCEAYIPQENITVNITGIKEANADGEEVKKLKQAVRNRIIWGKNTAHNENLGISHKIEALIFKSNYAQRFAFLSDSSPFKQACSKINENKEVNDACAILSNFLYCLQHPYNPERPIECQEFCKEYFLENPIFKKTVLSLQKQLHLDPKEVIDFMRALTNEAASHKSSELCSSSWASNLKAQLSELKERVWKSEEDEDEGSRFC